MAKRKAVRKIARKQCAANVKRHKLLREEPYVLEDGITYSMLSAFSDCRQRTEWSLQGWRPNDTKEALQYGSLMHDLLEHFGKGIIAGTITDIESGKALLGEHLDAWYEKRVASGEALANEIEMAQRIIAKANGIWPAYVETYARTDIKKNSWLELEGVFDVNWRGFRLRGRRDGMRKKNGALWLFETKTKSQISEDAIKTSLAFNPQALYYVTANNVELASLMKKARSARGIVGVEYNIIRHPSHKRTAKDKTWPDYSARIYQDACERPDHYFQRYEAAYSPEQIQAFGERLLVKLTEFARWIAGESPTYRNDGEGGACSKKWNCEFLKACAVDGKMSEVDYNQDGRLMVELED